MAQEFHDSEYKHVSANQIAPHLWVGNEASSQSPTWLRQHKIGLIVNATKDVPNAFQTDGIMYIRVPVDDLLKKEDTVKMTKVLPSLVECLHRKIKSGKNVLVHCHQGVQRSATIATAYIMKYYNLTTEQAINFVIKQRSRAFFGGSSINFEDSLREYRRWLDHPDQHEKYLQEMSKDPCRAFHLSTQASRLQRSNSRTRQSPRAAV